LLAYHDRSDGGTFAALCEMAFCSHRGIDIDLEGWGDDRAGNVFRTLFSEELGAVVQIAASLPATALFPVLLLLVLGMPGGLDVAAILLMLLGTQWYLLFNIIAGASAIPRELLYTSDLLQLSRWERWRSLILPAIFPYTITGAIAAGGGAWNASVVAEYTQFGGKTFHTIGVGALIAEATGAGDFPLLLAATLALILTVVIINRLFWQRLYRLAEERYRME